MKKRILILLLVSVLLFLIGDGWCYALVPLTTSLSFSELYYLFSSERAIKFISKLRPISFIGENSYPAYLISFVFAWYVPVIVNKYFNISGIVLWVLVWVIMVSVLPILSYLLTKLQSCVRRGGNRNKV